MLLKINKKKVNHKTHLRQPSIILAMLFLFIVSMFLNIQSVNAVSDGFSEDFTTTTYKDFSNTMFLDGDLGI